MMINFLKPVEISTYQIHGLKENKRFGNKIPDILLGWEKGLLNLLGICDTLGNLYVLIFNFIESLLQLITLLFNFSILLSQSPISFFPGLIASIHHYNQVN